MVVRHAGRGAKIPIFGVADADESHGIPSFLPLASARVWGAGAYDKTHAAACIRLGARFRLGGSDHKLLMAGATARLEFLRGLATG